MVGGIFVVTYGGWRFAYLAGGAFLGIVGFLLVVRGPANRFRVIVDPAPAPVVVPPVSVRTEPAVPSLAKPSDQSL